MKRQLLWGIALLAAACSTPPAEPTLKEAFADEFLVGTALNAAQITGQDREAQALIATHFNSIVAENCMKSEEIQPEEGKFDFSLSDPFVAFGEENGMFIIGHTLVWHSQLAPWFPFDKEGNKVTREVMIERLKNHITTLVSRYRGRIQGWDVVNEAILDDGTLRPTPFLEIIGEDYLELAFQFAHEADPDAELYYNDYSMASEGKRNRVVQLIRDLKAKGIRIDAVGMQNHMGLDHPSIEEFEKSLTAYAAEGVKVMITEWDITALPTVRMGAEISDRVAYAKQMNPYPDGMPAEALEAWNARLRAFVDLYEKHAEKISRVTVWGFSDGDSWRNDWPMPGRTDYPLLFDREKKLKPVVQEIINEKLSKK